MRHLPLAIALCGLLAAASPAQDRPRYPEGAPVPRNLTPEEKAWLLAHPRVTPLVPTAPPTGPVHCVAEYEPMEGIIMAWEGLGTWNDIQRQMTLELTTFANATVYLMVDSTAEQATVTTALQGAGVNMAKVRFLVTTTDTIWLRDYGPRYVYQGSCRAIVDHTYNRPRPLDDGLPLLFAGYKKHGFYEHQLVHGGGNYHLDAVGRSYATRLINNENPSLTEAQIVAIWQQYLNLTTTLYTPFPTTIDLTQHLDMWMQVIAHDKVVISDWPADPPTAVQKQICDQAAVLMAGRGYTVWRVPARVLGGVHYTYTNVVMCNQVVLVPTYSNGTVAPYNAQALAAWQQALPNHRITGIPCEAIVSYAGVMHCIVQHLPVPKHASNPAAYVKFPRGGETFLPNTFQAIRWISDDDQGVQSVDILLSTDGGQSYPRVLASAAPDNGSFLWLVPDLCGPRARIRIVARDAQGNTGGDESPLDFHIAGLHCAAANLPYGTGKAGAAGVPLLDAGTPPRLGATWPLGLSRALANAPALLLFGVQAASVPFDGGTILVDPLAFLPITTNAAGAVTLPIPLPDEPLLAGFSTWWQAWIPNDPGAAGLGWAASNGLQARFGY